MRCPILNGAWALFGPLIILFSTSCLICLLDPTSASAQRAPVDPRQLEKKIDSVEVERRRLQRPIPRTPNLAPVPPAGSNVPLFILNVVELEGATVLGDEQLRQAYVNFLGQAVSQYDLEAIAAAVSDIYRRAGFHLTRAIVPPQEVGGGRLRIRIIEGSIGDIKIEGGDERNRYALYRILEPILLERPSRLSSVERRLLVANDTVGLAILDTGLEEIGEATGKFRITLKVKTWRVYTTLGIDNSGSKAVGPLQTYFSTNLNSVLFAGDTLGLNLSAVPSDFRDLRSARLSYDTPLGYDGIKIGGSASYSEVWPNDSRRATETRTTNQTFQLRGSFAPLQTRAVTINVFGSLNYTDENEQDITGRLYNDHVRYVRTGTDIRIEDDFGGANYVTSALRQGLNIWEATQSDDVLSSRRGANPNFSVFEFGYTRYQKLGGPFSLKAAINGQLASTALLSSQLFYLGGAGFGPGYYSGDSGIAGLVELRFDHNVNSSWLNALQIYGFVDGGNTWTRGDDAPQHLISAGIGLRARILKEIYASFAYAFPLAQSSKTDEFSSGRILFSLSTALKVCPGTAQVFC